MFIAVINKSKLKKIIISILVIIMLIIIGITTVKNIDDKMTINQTPILYEQGTKENSNHAAIICNIDLGWESEYVEKILDTLEKENVKITFNVTGKWAEKNSELLLKIKDKGHEIGNHGHKHLDYATISYEENYAQIQTSKKIIEDIIKIETKFFQAPSGSFSEDTVKAANDLGYTCIKWDVDTIDWMNREEPNVIIERVTKKDPKENSIILMHPTYASSEAIDEIINIIKGKNLQPGKLSDIF